MSYPPGFNRPDVPPPWGQPQQPWAGPGWAPGSSYPPAGYGPAGYPAAIYGPRRSFSLDRARLLPTFVLAFVIAAVVLGGMALDGSISAPSAGTVSIGGGVTITAGPGWVRGSDSGSSGVIELKKADAILTAAVVQTGFYGNPSTLLDAVEAELRDQASQVSFSEPQSRLIGGNQASFATFEAMISTDQGSGVIDGEIVAIEVGGSGVVVEVATPQGRFDAVADDVTAMLKSLRAGQ